MRHFKACALVVCAAVVACVDSSGLGSVEDLDGGMDTALVVDGSVDSEPIDSEVPDGAVPDTELPDAKVPPDTAPLPDTRPVDADAGCSLTTCGTACVNTSNDINNCGGCGKICSATVKFSVACAAGMCACATNETNCGGSCTITREDSTACSGCGTSCAKDRYCRAGACECRPGLTLCGTTCIDTKGDIDHCGTCGLRCGGGEACIASKCEKLTCPTGSLACAGGGGTFSCFDGMTDPNNCGTCGKTCNADQLCIAGTCRKYAPAAGCSTCGGCATCTTLFGSGGRCCGALSGHSFPSCVDGPACP